MRLSDCHPPSHNHYLLRMANREALSPNVEDHKVESTGRVSDVKKATTVLCVPLMMAAGWCCVLLFAPETIHAANNLRIATRVANFQTHLSTTTFPPLFRSDAIVINIRYSHSKHSKSKTKKLHSSIPVWKQ